MDCENCSYYYINQEASKDEFLRNLWYASVCGVWETQALKLKV